MTVRTFVAPAAVLAGLALAACSETGGDAIAIRATDSACEVADTSLAAGKSTFEVANQGRQVTEVYVYGPGDRVVTERENIGPGTKATFSADLTAGTYEVACKPGQKGNGIRQDIVVTGKGGKAAVAADREVELGAVDYAFTGLDGVTIAKGDTIEFEMENKGSEEHEFEVFGPDGEALGEIGPTEPGKEGKVTLTFDEAGVYRVVCGIEDHEQKGMTAELTVT